MEKHETRRKKLDPIKWTMNALSECDHIAQQIHIFHDVISYTMKFISSTQCHSNICVCYAFHLLDFGSPSHGLHYSDGWLDEFFVWKKSPWKFYWHLKCVSRIEPLSSFWNLYIPIRNILHWRINARHEKWRLFIVCCIPRVKY